MSDAANTTANRPFFLAQVLTMEAFGPTPNFRWKAGVLEQAFHGTRGTVSWQAVPTVEDE